MHDFRHLKVYKDGDLSVVRFKSPLLRGSSVMEVGEELSAVAADEECRNFLLNFSNVESLYSDLLGTMLVVRRTMKKKGGKLMLCGMRPTLRDALSITKLDTVFEIRGSEEGSKKVMPGGNPHLPR